MPDRPRFYLTTAIAYANNAPGLHTVYEVIGADAIARWHRMKGDDTRFLTGTDEHSVNIAQSAEAQGRTPRDFVDEKVELFTVGRGRAAHQPRPVHPDDRPRPLPVGPGDRPAGVRQRRHLPRHVRGLVLPERGLQGAVGPARDGERHGGARTIPTSPLQWLTERNWFFRLSAYQERLATLYEEHPDFVQPEYRRNEMLGFIRQGLEDFSIIARRRRVGHPVPDRRGRPDRPARGRVVGSRGRHHLRLVRRAHQLHHRRGLPGRPGGVREVVAGRPARHRQGHRPVPHDLLAGDAVVGRASRRRARCGSTGS